MHGEDVLQWVEATPFVPFEIRMNSGRTYVIRHPEMIRVGHTHAVIFTYTGTYGGIHDRLEMIGVGLIESIRPMEATQSV